MTVFKMTGKQTKWLEWRGRRRRRKQKKNKDIEKRSRVMSRVRIRVKVTVRVRVRITVRLRVCLIRVRFQYNCAQICNYERLKILWAYSQLRASVCMGVCMFWCHSECVVLAIFNCLYVYYFMKLRWDLNNLSKSQRRRCLIPDSRGSSKRQNYALVVRKNRRHRVYIGPTKCFRSWVLLSVTCVIRSFMHSAHDYNWWVII